MLKKHFQHFQCNLCTLSGGLLIRFQFLTVRDELL